MVGLELDSVNRKFGGTSDLSKRIDRSEALSHAVDSSPVLWYHPGHRLVATLANRQKECLVKMDESKEAQRLTFFRLNLLATFFGEALLVNQWPLPQWRQAARFLEKTARRWC